MAALSSDELACRILTLLKLDANRLFERIKFRSPEYLHIFSVRRTREHFSEIFRNRYQSCTVDDLKYCGQEVIVGLDRFYGKVDQLKWYLYHTEDMPNTVDDRTHHDIKELGEILETLNLYIDAELRGSELPPNFEK